MNEGVDKIAQYESLSARRAWIEILRSRLGGVEGSVALRKESVDRNARGMEPHVDRQVALRKESVDRNMFLGQLSMSSPKVALRKESVDRNQESKGKCSFLLRRSPQGERG